MICVECAAPVDHLYTYYSEDNIHATKCTLCGNFADKYIECDKVLTFIDLLLLRKSAIRHVVFNAAARGSVRYAFSEKNASPPSIDKLTPTSMTPECTKDATSEDKSHEDRLFLGLSPTVWRLVIFVTLFDVYLLWAKSERSATPSVLHFLVVTHPAVQYFLFMTLCISDAALGNLIVRSMARYFIGWKNGGAISISLLIGSIFKLLPILTLIWHYDIPFVEHIVQYFSLYCITEILSITLSCGYLYAGLFTFVARIASIALYKTFWTLV